MRERRDPPVIRRPPVDPLERFINRFGVPLGLSLSRDRRIVI
jgi:hypothetical protein